MSFKLFYNKSFKNYVVSVWFEYTIIDTILKAHCDSPFTCNKLLHCFSFFCIIQGYIANEMQSNRWISKQCKVYK